MPVQPIIDALDALRRVRGERHSGVSPELIVTDRTEWTPAADFSDGLASTQLLAGPQLLWDAAPHAAGALAWKGYTYWLGLPAVIGYITSRRIPLLHADNVLVQLHARQPFVRIGMRRLEVAVLPCDPVAGQHGVQVVSDETALLELFRSTLIDQHLAPLLHELNRHIRVSRRAMWGSLASAVAQAAARAATVLPIDPMADAHQLLGALGLADLVDLESTPDGGIRVRRKTCCLAFTVPSLKICASCCLPPQP